MKIGNHVRELLFFTYFKQNDKFSKNTQLSNFMKIRPVRAELFLADVRPDRQKWRSQYSIFAILRTRLNICVHFMHLKTSCTLSRPGTEDWLCAFCYIILSHHNTICISVTDFFHNMFWLLIIIDSLLKEAYKAAHTWYSIKPYSIFNFPFCSY